MCRLSSASLALGVFSEFQNMGYNQKGKVGKRFDTAGKSLPLCTLNVV
jgi:hypothetical protein